MRFNKTFWMAVLFGAVVGGLLMLAVAVTRAQGHPPEVPNPGNRPSPNPGPVVSLPDDCTILRDAALANVDNRAEGYVYRMTVLKCVDIPWERLPQP